MQHNPMLLANVEIDQAQRQARARAERLANRSHHNRGAVAGLIGRLWRR
jgi:hypothetical protein